MPNKMKEKFASIKMILLDVDGVLTDGKIIYTDSGEEIKSFSVKDGLGIRLLMKSDIKVGIVTGRKAGGALLSRCRNLGINMIFDSVKDKALAIASILKSSDLSRSEVAFAGDDLPDIPAMKVCGVSFAVADASAEVMSQADYITRSKGGEGAVREICEVILQSRGIWEDIIKTFK